MENVTPREIIDPAAPAATAAPAAEPEDWKSFSWFLLRLVIVVLIFRSLVFTSFNIPSESMVPRLLVGDYLFAAKWSYGYSSASLPFSPEFGEGRILGSQPTRGDIAIFKHPVDRTDYIKRVIGLPGDTIQVTGGLLHINGTPVERHRVIDFVIPTDPARGCGWGREQFLRPTGDGGFACHFPRYLETLPNGVKYNTLDFGPALIHPQWGIDADNTAPVVVPADHVFMMGDSRDNSLDSRFPAEPGGGVGLVPQDNLVGEASFTYFSTDGSAQLFKPWTWFTAMRPSRMLRRV